MLAAIGYLVAAMPNWLDLLIVLWLCIAAFTGYRRGFIVEACSLLALFVGIYAAVHFSDHVGAWIGLGSERTIITFLVTFLIVIVLVHLLARALTALIDLAMLGLANRLAGIVAGIVRSLFMLSVFLNIVLAYSDGAIPPQHVREHSRLEGPIRSFAPMLIPSLGETKWIDEMIDRLRMEATGIVG